MTEVVWTAASVMKFVTERLSDTLAKRAPIDAAKRMQYLGAAAVLAVFDPDKLQPFDGTWVAGECRTLLAGDMVEVPGSAAGLRTLRPENREQGLAQFAGREEMLRARQRNGAPQPPKEDSSLRSAIGRVFDRLARGTPFEAQFMSLLEAARISVSAKLAEGGQTSAAILSAVLTEYGPLVADLLGHKQQQELLAAVQEEIPQAPDLPELQAAVRTGVSAAGSPADLQAAIDWVLNASIPEAGLLTEPQLIALLQAVRWFGSHLSGLPDVGTLQRTLTRRRLTGRFERLATGFFGRAPQLQQLREYVGVLEQSRGLKSFFFGDEVTPPLMLHGMGGIGKSSLLAKFILEHIGTQHAFPFVYLDFDNRFLDVEDVSTLVDEALSQLAAQYPDGAQIWDSFRPSLAQYSDALALAESASQDQGTLTVAGAAASIGTQTSMEEVLASGFASDLLIGIRSNLFHSSAGESALPFVLVLDTFEEVQKRSERAERLWRFLSHLQRYFPRLRLIVSGRAPLRDFEMNGREARNMQLPPFDSAAGEAILARMGVGDPAVAAAIFKQVGGNPLSLRLAAQVYREEGAGTKGIEGLKTSSFLVLSVSQSMIQGQLYQRILDHIPDLEVRKLAHPGLVVRRITPEVILKVLNEPCGLDLGDDLGAAADLFYRLRAQVDLVREEDGALIHRSDVREIMLRLLNDTRPDKVKAIHTKAVEYYHKEIGPVARAEELYHLLQLDPDHASIDAAWSSEAVQSVLSSKDELPLRAQAYLALKTNTDLDPSIRKLVDLEQWELLVEQKVRELIRLGGIATADLMLKERKERSPGSPLYSLDATLLILQNHLLAAEEVLRVGIDSVGSTDRKPALLEMVRVRADLYAQTGRRQLAMDEYKRAEELAAGLGKSVLQMSIALQRLKTEEEGSPQATAPTPESTEYLKQVLDSVADSDFLDCRGQLTGMFQLLGPIYPDLLVKGLEVFTAESIPPERVPTFPASTAIALNSTEPGRVLARRVAQELSVAVDENLLQESAAPWPDLVANAARKRRLNELALRVLAFAPGDRPLLLWISELLELAIAPVVQSPEVLRARGVSHA